MDRALWRCIVSSSDGFPCWTGLPLFGAQHKHGFVVRFSFEPWQWSTTHYWLIGHRLGLIDAVSFFLTRLVKGLHHRVRQVLPRCVIVPDYLRRQRSMRQRSEARRQTAPEGVAQTGLSSALMQYQSLSTPPPALTSALPTSVALWLTSVRASLNPGAEDERILQRIAQVWLSS